MNSQFIRFDEYPEFDPEPVLEVLPGRRLGVIFRDAIPTAVREEMTARFWNSPGLTRRTGEPSHHVGTYHWNKPIDAYLAETSKVVHDVMDVLDVADSPWHTFRDRMNAQCCPLVTPMREGRSRVASRAHRSPPISILACGRRRRQGRRPEHHRRSSHGRSRPQRRLSPKISRPPATFGGS